MRIAMIDDDIVSPDELHPALLDRGVFFGDGVYEVIRSYRGKIFAFDDHLQRFANSLAAVRIKNVAIELVRSRVMRAFEQAQIPDAKIYFHITRGSGPRDHTFTEDMKPNFFLTVDTVPDASAAKEAGISVSTHPDWRWKRCDIKSLNLLANVLARQDAAEKGCDEAIFVDEQGLITEGAASAFFAIIDQKLYTTALSGRVLPSITRKFVLKAASNICLEVIEKSITPNDARSADELFIGVTTKDIVPVVRFDGTEISGGRPGSLTERLIAEFRKFT